MFGRFKKATLRVRLAAIVVMTMSATWGQASPTAPYPAFDWISNPPTDCPFEPSTVIAGITFTGRHREYTGADTWVPSWAADGHLYSPFADGAVKNLLPDGTTREIWTLGQGKPGKGITPEQQAAGANCGYGKITGDDPWKLTVVGLGALPTPGAPYGARYPSGSLVHNGVWYYGSHPEGGGGIGPLTGFRISRDYGKTWSDEPNDPAHPVFKTPALDEHGKPNWWPIRIAEPFFVDFGKNMEHSPDGKAYLVAHGVTPSGTPGQVNSDQPNSSWNRGDEAYLLRVLPSPETINDSAAYEFFAGHDDAGVPIWTKSRSKMKPLIDWKGKVGPTSMTYNPGLKKYLFCITDGSIDHGKYDTYILESSNITGPWKLVVFMESFGEEAYFVNIPSKFISKDGRTATLWYSANFSAGMKNPPKLKSNPPGSRYGMNVQEIRLRVKAP